jgi:hypothetical protein
MSEFGTCPAYGTQCEYVATVASQAAQIERLREALTTIAGPPERDPDLPPIYQPRWSVEQSRYIARAALQPKEGEG